MKQLNIQEAKTHLSRLIDEAVAGEEIVIARAGRPQVRLVACLAEQTPRVLGVPAWQAKGNVWLADDFDAVDERVIQMFEGEGAPARKKDAKAKAKSKAKAPRRPRP